MLKVAEPNGNESSDSSAAAPPPQKQASAAWCPAAARQRDGIAAHSPDATRYQSVSRWADGGSPPPRRCAPVLLEGVQPPDGMHEVVIQCGPAPCPCRAACPGSSAPPSRMIAQSSNQPHIPLADRNDYFAIVLALQWCAPCSPGFPLRCRPIPCGTQFPEGKTALDSLLHFILETPRWKVSLGPTDCLPG